MNQAPGMQQNLFREIQRHIGPEHQCVHEISELLGIGTDSAYRRIRGETPVSLEELYLLSRHFGISVDSLFEVRSGKVAFDELAVEPGSTNLPDWLKKIHQDLQQLSSLKNPSIIYAAKDIPFFHFFQVPEIAAFKVFFWQKTLFNFREYRDKKFSFDEYDETIQEIGEKLLLSFIKTPAIEIWNEDTFSIFLRQIEHYWISGVFRERDDIELLCDKLELWIRHMESQAEHGYKYHFLQSPHGVEHSFQLYENEVVLNDNSVLIETGERKIAYLTYNVISLLVTEDPAFCGRLSVFIKGLIKNSILISTSASKERSRFFNAMMDHVAQFRHRIAAMNV
ncbi:MAG TPA: helix-turn-helix domain-containing protein [Bacteroidales bacterium]|nr:helix-turn-helix domain-containing protein [Bacteroidales bacterium]